MDTGKKFRNLYKKKLSEYVQTKELKGDQDTHSETVPVTQNPIKSIVPRTQFELDLNFYRYRKSKGQTVKEKVPVKIQATLSNEEKKKIQNVAQSIATAIKLNNAPAIVDRLNNLLKRMTAEAKNYSIDYNDAMLNVLKNLLSKINILITDTEVKKNISTVKNVFNQMIELLEEKQQELLGSEEGTPAIQAGPQKLNLDFEENPTEGAEEAEAAEESGIPKLNFGIFKDKKSTTLEKRQKLKKIVESSFNVLYENLQTTEEKNFLYNKFNTFAKKIKSMNSNTLASQFSDFKKKLIEDIKKKFNIEEEIEEEEEEEEEVEPPSAPAAVEEEEEVIEAPVAAPPQKKIYKLKSKNIKKIKSPNIFKGPEGPTGPPAFPGFGTRKTRHNAHTGFTGYGKPVINPNYNKGYAVAPINLNSPFGLPSYSAFQSYAVPKFLNIGVIPNKKGTFAVLG
jgi:hypothetical protein